MPTNSLPAGFGIAPTGWTILGGTTDINNKDFGAGVIVWLPGTTDAPNGHSVWSGGATWESIGTTISDLIVGESYIMRFYMCELRYLEEFIEDGTLQVIIGGDEFLFPFTGGVIQVAVIDCDPVYAGFEMPVSICIDQCFTLNDTSSGPIIDWVWGFGGAVDPNTSILQNPTICLNTAGTFTIALTVMNEVGTISTI